VPAILVSFVVGAVAGIVITIALMRRAASERARAHFELWRTAELRGIRRDALDSERSTLKERVGAEVAERMEPFPFVPADARFIGHPVQFVVFDGHTEVKDREAEALRGVVFVSIGNGNGIADADARLVEECVTAGRLSWLTLSMPKTNAT
jgi:predicted Holliday junction resolvase-like endonuclease